MTMDRRKFLAASLGFAASAAFSNIISKVVFAKQSKKRPNIILINTDDHPSWWVGCYGNEDVYTPNMDKLASEGILFKNAVTVPVCSPSRAMLLTGRYNNQVGVDEVIGYQLTGLPSGSITFAQVLRNTGYTTGIVGKWHLGEEPVYWPTLRGFDYWAGWTNAGGPRNPTLIVKKANNREEKKKYEGFTLNILTDHAINFVRENREKPFMLYLAYPAPHMGYMPVPEEDLAHYSGKVFKLPDYKMFPEARNYPEERLQKDYLSNYAPVTTIDRNMGRIFTELKNLELEENTIIIFTGDNGYCLGRHGLTSKGNSRFLGTTIARPNMFDDSIVVPLIVRWPDVIKPGSTCDKLVSHIDIFPTLMEIAGLNPANIPHLEGISMVPLFKQEEKIWKNEVYLIYDMKYHAVAHMRMIRTDNWKLIHHYEDETKNELYDLDNDPGELENLYGKESVKHVQHILTRRLKKWEKRVGASKEDILKRHEPY